MCVCVLCTAAAAAVSYFNISFNCQMLSQFANWILSHIFGSGHRMHFTFFANFDYLTSDAISKDKLT